MGYTIVRGPFMLLETEGMLYKFVNGIDTTAEGDLIAFSDGDTVGSYAKDAVGWAVSNGLIGGMEDGTIAPKATATRAQVATVLMRYSEAFK